MRCNSFRQVAWRLWLACGLAGISSSIVTTAAQAQTSPPVRRTAQVQLSPTAPLGSPEPVSGIPIEPAIQGPIPEFDLPVSSIDLPSALRLAGVANPQILIARQRVVAAVADRQLAAAQILPTINLGTNFDAHSGNLQQSDGNILNVSRSALYVGAGANAVGSGTVNIPGVVWNLNVSDAIYLYLVSQQRVEASRFGSVAVRNQMLLDVTIAYSELLRAEGERVIALKVRDEAAEVARLTRTYAEVGEGRQADAERAASELASRETDLLEAEGAVITSSARLRSCST